MARSLATSLKQAGAALCCEALSGADPLQSSWKQVLVDLSHLLLFLGRLKDQKGLHGRRQVLPASD